MIESDLSKYKRTQERTTAYDAFNRKLVCFRPNGITPMVVTSANAIDNDCKTRYLNGTGEYECTVPFVIIATNQPYENEEIEEMTTLYELKNRENETYGTKVGVKSDGKWLMEIKGSGDVVAVDKNDLEEVLPYTVGIKFIGSGSTEYHYISDKGLVEVGDFVLIKGSLDMATVTAVDTKSRKATKRLVGSVLKGVSVE